MKLFFFCQQWASPKKMQTHSVPASSEGSDLAMKTPPIEPLCFVA